MEVTKEQLAWLIKFSYQEGFKTAIAVLEGILPNIKEQPDLDKTMELLEKAFTKPLI